MRQRVILALAALAFAACEPPPVAAEQKRVVVANPVERTDAAGSMRRERAGVLRIDSDARDAWVFTIDGRARLPALSVGPGDAVQSAATLALEPDAPESGVVRLSLTARDAGKPAWEGEIDLSARPRRWADFRISGEASAASLDLELTAEWVGTPPRHAERVRAAFEIPRVAKGAHRTAPNVLLLTVDTLRADRLGCYGYARPTSPRIDALAASGVRFANAYSPAPWTLPAYGSLFTGMLPGEHRAGVVTEREALWGKDEDSDAKRTEALRPDVPTLAESFQRNHRRTAMFSNNPYLVREAGLERGFQRYVTYGANAANGVDLALEWIDGSGHDPWFLVLHLMDPHFPYAPPAPYDREFAGRSVDELGEWPPNLGELRKGRPSEELAKLSSDLYDGEIAFTDAQIGRLLDGLTARGLIANTIVALHADHGEEFWEHGSCDHGHALHEELLRVPIVIAWPAGNLPSAVVEPRMRAQDLGKTLLWLADDYVLDTFGALDLSFLPRWKGSSCTVIAEAIHAGPREIKAYYEDTEKLVASGASTNRLYALSQDPGEHADLSSVRLLSVRKLRLRLTEHHARSLWAADRSESLELDMEKRRRLGQIGYGGGADDK